MSREEPAAVNREPPGALEARGAAGAHPSPPDESDAALRAQALLYAQDLRAIYETARDQAARFRRLVEVGEEMLAARDLDNLLALALERAMALSGYDGGSVLLAAGTSGTLEVRASLGADAVPLRTGEPTPWASVASRALQARRPILLSGRGEELGTAWRLYTRRIPSSICLPLLTPSGEPLGVLALKSTRRSLPLDAHHLDALELLAGQLAGMVTHLQLHDRVQRSRDVLYVLYEAGKALGSTLDADEIGRRLLTIAEQTAGLTAVGLYLRRGGRLRLGAVRGEEPLWRWARRTATAREARAQTLNDGTPRAYRLQRRGATPLLVAAWTVPLQAADRLLGLLEAYAPAPTTTDETLDVLGSLANQAATALDNARLYRELATREEQLGQLVGRLLVAQEEERRRVAYDVHDELAQVAVAAHLHLQGFARRHRPRSPEARERLAVAIDLANRSVQSARRVIADLRPTVLDDFGLATAVRQQVEELRDEGWDVAFDEALGAGRLAPPVETAFFRVAQEALSNVRKHAGRTRVRVALQQTGRGVRLEVQDWGCGFQVARGALPSGRGEQVGLAAMRERMALLGGRCRISSRPGAGTRVVAEVPLRSADGRGG
jgi:signal transduction histidine kinase